MNDAPPVEPTKEEIAEAEARRLKDLSTLYFGGSTLLSTLDITDLIRLQHAKIGELRQAVELLRNYAAETHRYWDNSKDHKVGKRLMAMAGCLPSYSAEVNAALASAKEHNCG